MRFRLQERVGRRRFRAVAAPGLGVWRKSRPGVRRFAVTPAGARAGRGRLLPRGRAVPLVRRGRQLIRSREEAVTRSAARRGACPTCGCAASLALASRPDTVRYAVQIVSTAGRAAAGPSASALAVDGDVVDTRGLGALAPGATRRVFVERDPPARPACARTSIPETPSTSRTSSTTRAARLPVASLALRSLTVGRSAADTMADVSATSSRPPTAAPRRRSTPRWRRRATCRSAARRCSRA